jgi:uncharacterized protein (DUF1778 family)
MINATFQLTIRGLNKETKDALQQKASQQGMSLNKYALKALQQGAGIDVNGNRYLEIKEFLGSHSMDAVDKAAFDDALTWADKASREKQAKDDYDLGI